MKIVSLGYSQSCASITTLNFGTFLPSQKEAPYSLAIIASPVFLLLGWCCGLSKSFEEKGELLYLGWLSLLYRNTFTNHICHYTNVSLYYQTQTNGVGKLIFSPPTLLCGHLVYPTLFFFFLSLMFLVYHRQPTSVRALKPLSLCSCPLRSPTHFSNSRWLF